ncbi:outer membrane lipid asymmetry maintenance protein MlaD [Sphingomonas oleivorans]|uniref:Outer membrane lipid asymmetry maintenance protein MlaD n=1 Tax=Sphingomonas oleivorans TaxID=1735121 RepID=A0A2T5FVC5_9SPHN|nr:outer membrane lipid asymmetry maintenance protein MlaD [Sphingomonas oleivorans]PTQ09395.1 outer membrane lipid asymmetry maintenance protein MlaD [Sphingomonas oleivorans]
MKTILRENVVEAIVGLAVVLLAIWFVLFAWDRTGGGAKANAITVTALFPNAAGVTVGTDVRVAGLKIGSVTDQKLDPQTFQVAVKLAIDPSVKLPADSSASVTSEGLLGSTFIGLTPGGSETSLKNGDMITDTQGAMDLMALIGQFINRPSSDSAATGNGTAPTAP